jgi:hypothetical protein
MGSVSTISKFTSDRRLAKNFHAFAEIDTLIKSKCEMICSLFIAPNRVFSDVEATMLRIKFNTITAFELCRTVFAKSSTYSAIF